MFLIFHGVSFLVPYASGLKFRIKELYCLCRENQDADQLCGDLRLCFRICKKQVFSRRSIIDKLIGEFLLHCGSFNHTNKVKKQGNKCDVVRGIAGKVFNKFKTIFE